MVPGQERCVDVATAVVDPRVHLVLVGFRPEVASRSFRDRCVGGFLGVLTLTITLIGPEAAMRVRIAGMDNPLSDVPIPVWIWWLVAASLLSLATQLLSVSLLRAMNSRVTALDLDGVAQQPWLIFTVCFASIGLHFWILGSALRQRVANSIHRDALPAQILYIEVFATLFTWIACVTLCCLVYFEIIRPTFARCFRRAAPSGTGELLTSDRSQDPECAGSIRSPRVGVVKQCLCCCSCCAASTLVMVLASIGAWFVTVPSNAGIVDPGQPLSEEQWETMNHRDLVFCEMSMRMAQANAYNKWGDNAGPGGIADAQAFHYRPEGAPEPYPNKYVSSILETRILGSDRYTFPGEAPLSPRWTVLRVRYNPGHGGDDLVIVFRGSTGDPYSALDWTRFDTLNEPSAVSQDDGMRFTKGFFDESLCVLMQRGLFEVLQSKEAAGVSKVFAIGHSLGGAWASILMTRLAPGKTMTCPDNLSFSSPFGSLHAHAVTFGKPAPFYVARDSPIPDAMRNLASRETDYVYHADTIARADHGATTYCNEFCFQLLPWSSLPYLKTGQTVYIAHHYHGDTTTVWIANDLTDKNAPMLSSPFPVASKSQIGVYFNEKERWEGINLGFVVGRFIPFVLSVAGQEHGNGYTYSMWRYQP